MNALLLAAVFSAMTTDELADNCRDAICHRKLAALDYYRTKAADAYSSSKSQLETLTKDRRKRRVRDSGRGLIAAKKSAQLAESAYRKLESEYKPQKELIEAVRTKQKPMPKEWIAKMPDLASDGFDFGLVDKCRVLQILGPNEFLGTQWHEGAMAKQTYLFRGWPTKEVNEGEAATIPTLGYFADQYTYQAVSGAKKTVRVIQIISDDQLLEVYKKLTEPDGPRA